MDPLQKDQTMKSHSHKGSSHARKTAVLERRDDKIEGEPLTTFQHREMMRQEAEESRLEILRLRANSEAYNRSVRSAP